MQQEQTTEESFERRLFVATEYVALQDGKEGIAFRELVDGKDLGRERFYPRSKFRSATIGSVYSMVASDKTVQPTTIKWDSLWPGRTDRLQWQAKARAHETARAAEKLAKSEQTRNALKEALEPLLSVYFGMGPRQRIALEVLVLSYLRSGGRS